MPTFEAILPLTTFTNTKRVTDWLDSTFYNAKGLENRNKSQVPSGRKDLGEPFTMGWNLE